MISPEELREQEEALVTTIDAEEQVVTVPEGMGSELAAVREVVLRAHPDVVPELVHGATVAEVLASIEPARAAYARIAAQIGPAPTASPVLPAPAIPAGGAGPVPIDPDRLPAPEKIRRGLASR
jgi:hypothetical protein